MPPNQHLCPLNGDETEEVDPEDVEIGSVVVVRPGDKVPLDGVVIEGESFIDTSALTGESVPRRVSEGDDIISGMCEWRRYAQG